MRLRRLRTIKAYLSDAPVTNDFTASSASVRRVTLADAVASPNSDNHLINKLRSFPMSSLITTAPMHDENASRKTRTLMESSNLTPKIRRQILYPQHASGIRTDTEPAEALFGVHELLVPEKASDGSMMATVEANGYVAAVSQRTKEDLEVHRARGHVS